MQISRFTHEHEITISSQFMRSCWWIKPTGRWLFQDSDANLQFKWISASEEKLELLVCY